MAGRIRRRMRLFGPYGHGGPWFQSAPPYGPGFGWGWHRRPTLEDEKEYVEEYIAMLKEELATAEEYLQELENEK